MYVNGLNDSEYVIFLNLMGKTVLGAFIAFFMELSEVLVVTYTSSLTLSIAGIFKVHKIYYVVEIIIINMFLSGNYYFNSCCCI